LKLFSPPGLKAPVKDKRLDQQQGHKHNHEKQNESFVDRCEPAAVVWLEGLSEIFISRCFFHKHEGIRLLKAPPDSIHSQDHGGLSIH
jgi:hypothetical protein